MPITSVTYQPNTGSINAVYRPVIFRCTATIPNATAQNYICPVVFCDVYVDGIYYKTLSRSQYISNLNNNPEYEFDIQDAIQELMSYNLPEMDGTTIQKFSNTIKKVFVKFRNTYYDQNGFSKSEQIAPVQGTSSVAPITGAGVISNEIYILNSAIQHEEKQDLDQLLQSYTTGTWSNALPLTKRPQEFKLCRKDSSHFPIISEIKPKILCVKAKMKTGEIVDLCTEIFEECPKLENIQYTISQDVENNIQIIIFSWVNPTNMPQMPYEIKIYKRLHGTNDPWSTITITVFPNPVNSHQVILPIAYYDFVFEILGSCKGVPFNNLPYILNIGSEVNEHDNPPTVNIKWQDNSGTEDRVCNASTCNSFTIVIDAADPDNDIAAKEVLVSYDNGVTWLSLISNISGNTFGTGALSTLGTRLFKVIVTDLNNNSAVSNLLSYTKQQTIRSLYRKIITGVTCSNSHGDSPTNYDVYCTGSEDFAFSDNFLINTTVGFIRLTVDANSNEIGISKSGGGALIINESIPVTTILTASYAAVGQNPPSAYPWGYPANTPPAIYTFEYSVNGTSGWTSFDFNLDD